MTKKEIYQVLAKNRYAKRPESVSAHQWGAIKSIMERRYMQEYMETPEGLYTDAQIWAQTFKKYIDF